MIDFIIIGEQRCGTTSLYNYLIEHPKISPAVTKEIHFFSLHYSKGIEWYWKQFPSLSQKYADKEKPITGESTPYYLFHPLAPKRIFNHLPDVKMIVLLRNPAERAFSHYNHAIRVGNESLSFREAIKKEPERLEGEEEKIRQGQHSFNHQRLSYLARGIYAEQLERHFELFQKEQILILKCEDFFDSPQKILNKVLSFLDLDNFELESFKKFNFGNNPSMDEKVRNELIEYFKPHNERLYKLLGVDFGWK